MVSRQFMQLHRLVELHAVLTGNFAQRLRRDVAGQDDDGDLTVKLLAQSCGQL